ncbi:serine hydrolase domain-containing protein [Alkalihalobacterium alkalinitrilicum]|uniref:serine hydrolase domain-containing protein n=1 Tax=Alkalihalobacterium alkalinitrilicum TaxID=427920 RepID=UPI000994E84E|nr:serine hydrolase domain-containing protein [Alkalihalobacterium alkalinitrilicum]
MNNQQLDNILKQSIGDTNIPGVVACVANDQGMIYEGAFGQRSLDSDVEMTTDSVFWIASMTKAVTSVAAMQLVEQGKLELDKPLKSVLPQLNEIGVMEGVDNDGQPIVREPKNPITLRHLLTHTAGFTYHFFNEDTIKYIQAKNLPDITECKNDALMTALAFDPGELWEYGINTDWVGKAIEAVTGQSLRDYFQENIFSPLGMKDTDFVIQSEARERLVAMHARAEEQKLVTMPFEIPQEPEFFMAGGGLYSTAGDYMKLLQMILHGGTLNGKQILKNETIEEMGKNQIGDLNVGALVSTNPALTNDYEAFPEMDKKWGLGFLITTEDAATGRRAGSLSWAGLANTYFWIDPVSKITGVVLTQILPFADQKVLNLVDQFEAKIYEEASEKLVSEGN